MGPVAGLAPAWGLRPAAYKAAAVATEPHRQSVLERPRGIEPLSARWQRTVLAAGPRTLSVWRPHGESNPDLLIDNQLSWPLDDGSVVDRVGFEPTISRLRGGCCADLATDPRFQRAGGQGRNRTVVEPGCNRPLCHLATRPGAPSRCRAPHTGFWRPDWTPVPGAYLVTPESRTLKVLNLMRMPFRHGVVLVGAVGLEPTVSRL